MYKINNKLVFPLLLLNSNMNLNFSKKDNKKLMQFKNSNFNNNKIKQCNMIFQDHNLSKVVYFYQGE